MIVRRYLLAILIIPLVVSGQTSTWDREIAPGSPSAIPVRSKTIMPDLYLLTGRGGNAVIRSTAEGLFLIDNKVQYNLVWEEILTHAEQKTGSRDIRIAFVTHHHADHSGNNQKVIDAGADLIAHENIVGILQNYRSIIAPVNPAMPTITFEHSYRVSLGGVEAIAYHWGSSHTEADIAVFFPDQRSVVVGDMLHMSGEIAIDGPDGHGSLLGMLDRVDNLLQLDFLIAVPGHGDNVFTYEEVALYRDRLAAFIDRGKQLIENGVSQEDWVDAVQPYDLGFRLVGHFWTSPVHFAPVYNELAASIARE